MKHRELLEAIYKFIEKYGRDPDKIIIRKDILKEIEDELKAKMRVLKEEEPKEADPKKKKLPTVIWFNGIPIEIAEDTPGGYRCDWILQLDKPTFRYGFEIHNDILAHGSLNIDHLSGKNKNQT